MWLNVAATKMGEDCVVSTEEYVVTMKDCLAQNEADVAATTIGVGATGVDAVTSEARDAGVVDGVVKILFNRVLKYRL